MKTYNGHRSWNAWNVSLWLYNDEPLYRMVQSSIERNKTLGAAVRSLMRDLGGEKTPDGAKYTAFAVRLAIAEDWNEARSRGRG